MPDCSVKESQNSKVKIQKLHVNSELRTQNLRLWKPAPDPGNAGVGRGNKLSVLRIRPDAADGLTNLFKNYFEKFTYGVIRLAAASPGIGPIFHFRKNY